VNFLSLSFFFLLFFFNHLTYYLKDSNKELMNLPVFHCPAHPLGDFPGVLGVLSTSLRPSECRVASESTEDGFIGSNGAQEGMI
jgi:hypothetical protein